MSVQIQTADFDVGTEWRAMHHDVAGVAGGIAAFSGLVRGQFAGHAVETLFLEHYPGMTETSIQTILSRAAARFELNAARVIHRVGRLEPGEQIVLVLCAAEHRGAAFDACQYVMDYLKKDAVFWKKETGARGARWVQSTRVITTASNDGATERLHWGDAP
ncbi:MAG: molybdenum cofactor biosynthesis protein MoaE [Gammaproteobacteria bacterium]|nr:molybdenum cofactor biosynthesis protein MoaE [Gammaproteobacteria bacterium]